jgi:hypothetical protein
MTYPKTKEEITQLVFTELPQGPENVWSEISIDDLVFRWWQTGRGGSGLRLTEQGMQAFAIAKLAHYDFPLDKKIKAAEWDTFILRLTKKLACPYYLGVYKDSDRKGPYIRIYDHKIAMMLTLYGTLSEYIESVK